ncbi:sterol desaturase family protein, partial [Mycobacterium tuberculosis]|uniref:sterol desaturase family protein n=15 Tax=Mycobacterium tuberculosis TaxID=1773 RepID=UPI001F243A68
IRTARSRSSGGYLLDEPPDMTPSFPRTGVSGHAGAVQMGLPPWMVFCSWSLNLIYQFWVHTERIDRLPRWFEFVFNTPSHHRVHHGMDPVYLDKNYGGILIIWDRLFGSFQPELFRPHYGLTKRVDTFNIWKLQTREYVAIVRDWRSATRLRDRLGYVFGPPGWEPRTIDKSNAAASLVTSR